MENTDRMTYRDRVTDFTVAVDSLGKDGCKLIKGDGRFGKFLKENGFFTAPASTQYHGNYEGGLYDHSYQVYKRLLELTVNNGLQWQRHESPFIIGMFHDLCKIDQYILSKDEKAFNMITGTFEEYVYRHNENTMLKGHGTKSVMLLSQFINLTEEEMLCIRFHMGAYETEDWKSYDLAIRKYPNLLYVNLADMYVSKVDGM